MRSTNLMLGVEIVCVYGKKGGFEWDVDLLYASNGSWLWRKLGFCYLLSLSFSVCSFHMVPAVAAAPAAHGDEYGDDDDDESEDCDNSIR